MVKQHYKAHVSYLIIVEMLRAHFSPVKRSSIFSCAVLFRQLFVYLLLFVINSDQSDRWRRSSTGWSDAKRGGTGYHQEPTRPQISKYLTYRTSLVYFVCYLLTCITCITVLYFCMQLLFVIQGQFTRTVLLDLLWFSLQRGGVHKRQNHKRRHARGARGGRVPPTRGGHAGYGGANHKRVLGSRGAGPVHSVAHPGPVHSVARPVAVPVPAPLPRSAKPTIVIENVSAFITNLLSKRKWCISFFKFILKYYGMEGCLM